MWNWTLPGRNLTCTTKDCGTEDYLKKSYLGRINHNYLEMKCHQIPTEQNGTEQWVDQGSYMFASKC